MTTFYLICFTLGFALTVMSALGAFSHVHFGHFHGMHGMHGMHGVGHLHGTHVGHVAHGAGHGVGHGGKAGVGPLNGFTLAAFLCWFGGCGYLLSRLGTIEFFVVLVLALLTGLAGGAILFWFLVKVLLRHDRELTAEDTEIVGVLALVTGAVREGGTGEIQFSQNGSRHFAPARSDAGGMLARGTEVVVMRYEQGIAYVRAWDELAGEISAPPAETSTQ